MRVAIILLALFATYNFASAQGVTLGFNSTASGRNVTAQYEIFRNKSTFSFGLGYNINQFAHNDDQNEIYIKRLYATKPYHHLNINLSYQYNVLTETVKNTDIFLFYDVQAQYSTTRNRFLLPFRYDSTLVVNTPEEGVLYREYIRFYGPFYWVQQNIGIGFKVPLTQKIYMKQRLGVGTQFVMGYDDMIAPKLFNWFHWMFGGLYHFSLGVNLK